MVEVKDRRVARKKRHARVRRKVQGVTDRPRLCVFRSLGHIYAQVIDDTRGHTLVVASSLEGEVKGQLGAKTKTERARAVGALLAKRALERGISTIVFDRGGYKYHGRVKALAEAAREIGLVF